MAIRLGIMGPPNSGKSYSRKFLKNPEEVFLLSSSIKALYLNNKDGKPLPRLNVASPNAKNFKEIMEGKKKENPAIRTIQVVKSMINAPKDALTFTGNWTVVQEMADLQAYMKLIDKQMPHIKMIIIPDFTHYINKVIASDEFRNTSGGKAFERFYSLAADALNSFILTVDSLRDDIIVVTEYHAEYDDNLEYFKIFVPSGKMLSEKLQPESYYDIMLCTKVDLTEDGKTTPESYKFIVNRVGPYNARSMGLFEEDIIPNNLQTVVDKVRDYYQF
jgi:hypothetical protein